MVQALIMQYFWNRWKTEYLTSLREMHRVNSGTNKERIKIDDVAVVHDNIPSQSGNWQ